MIWSKYNYIYKSQKHGWLLFNLLSGTCLDISDDDDRKELLCIRDNIDTYDFSDKKELYDALQSNGIICFDDDENKNLIEYVTLSNMFNQHIRNLTIIPTLSCNLACTYCYAAKNLKNEIMSRPVIERLKEYINEQYTGIQSGVYLNWYGGEPLLAFDIIKEISYYMKDKNIQYKAAIVTNAILLTKEKIELLDELNIKELQITLDGVKENHDRRRMFKNGSGTFDIILSNLSALYEYTKDKKDFIIDIRINVDKENESDYHTLYNEISNKYPSFRCYPGILRQYSTCNSSIRCFANQTEVADFLIRQYDKYNINSPMFFPYLKGLTSCMAESPYTNMVGPNGELYLCLKDVGDEKECIGDIFKGKTNTRLAACYGTGYLTFRSDECRDCNVVTLCGGGCANLKYRNKKYSESNDACVPFKNMTYLEKYLDIHYEQKKKLTR